MQTRETTDQMLVAEVAKALDVVPSTVRHMERVGTLKAARTSSGVRLFARADVESLISKRRVQKNGGE